MSRLLLICPRKAGNTLKPEAELKKTGRRTHHSQTTFVDCVEVSAVRWLDKGAVNMASTYTSVNQGDMASRWDAKSKRKVDVPVP